MTDLITEQSPARTGGVVEVAGRTFLVEKLPARQEEGLANLLEAEAKKAAGKGGHFAAFRDELEWLREAGLAAEWQQLLRYLPELKVLGVPPVPIVEFRKTPRGAALELYHRTRGTHAEVALDQIAAVITEVNAPDVAFQIAEAVTDGRKSR